MGIAPILLFASPLDGMPDGRVEDDVGELPAVVDGMPGSVTVDVGFDDVFFVDVEVGVVVSFAVVCDGGAEGERVGDDSGGGSGMVLGTPPHSAAVLPFGQQPPVVQK